MPRALYKGPLEDHEGNIIYNENSSDMIKHNTGTVKTELESHAAKLLEVATETIGDTTTLQTVSKVVVGAINENTAKLSELDEDIIGDTATLQTVSKVVVGAINENATKIGDTASLTTTSKVVVGAINENTAAIGSTASLTTTSKVVVGAINENKASITANKAQIDNMCGKVSYYARTTAPTGYLKANGATISRVTYASLFSAIGTTFGAGDGSTTFKLPDLRGQFIRSYDDGAGVDSGRAFGSLQDDSLEAHNHFIYTQNDGTGYSSAGTILSANPTIGSGTPTSQYTNATGGTETRPKNIALLACIKY